MGLTISEATDVNVLANYLLNRDSTNGGRPTPMQAKAALAHLVVKAHKKLGAGVTEDDVLSAHMPMIATPTMHRPRSGARS